jgi:hypothetical protein
MFIIDQETDCPEYGITPCAGAIQFTQVSPHFIFSQLIRTLRAFFLHQFASPSISAAKLLEKQDDTEHKFLMFGVAAVDQMLCEEFRSGQVRGKGPNTTQWQNGPEIGDDFNIVLLWLLNSAPISRPYLLICYEIISFVF